MSLRMPSIPPVSMNDLLAYKDIVHLNIGMVDDALDGLRLDNRDFNVIGTVSRSLTTVRNITGYLGLDEAKGMTERSTGMALGALRNAKDVVSLVGQIPAEVAALERVATGAFGAINEILPSLPMSVEELSAYKDLVFEQFGAIGNAIGSFSLDNFDLSLTNDVLSGLTTISNIAGIIGLDEVGAFAEKAARMAYGAVQTAKDVVAFIEELPAEIANLEDMVMDGFDQLAETISGLGDTLGELDSNLATLGNMPILSADMGTYNPALDSSADTDMPRHAVGSFGSVAFQVSEEVLALVSGFQRKIAARVEEHQVVGEKPRLEFIAPELQKTTFTVFWHRAFGLTPRKEIKKLQELCEAGATQHLIMGGENFGKCLLLDVTEDWGKSGPSGSPITARASLTFKEYR